MSQGKLAMMISGPWAWANLMKTGIDFGIATTPWELIGKSGATAAMLDHGLPVIVSRDDVHIPVDVEPEPQPLLCKMDAQLPSWLLNVAQRQPPREHVTEVAERFLADLAAQSRDVDEH